MIFLILLLKRSDEKYRYVYMKVNRDVALCELNQWRVHRNGHWNFFIFFQLVTMQKNVLLDEHSNIRKA